MRNTDSPQNGLGRLLQALRKTEVEAEEPASFEEFLRRRGHGAEEEEGTPDQGEAEEL